MNDIWSMLGIEPTDDKKAVRRAFAAQSRLHHPEEEPEYFAALNQAYKAALDYEMSGEKKEEYKETLQGTGRQEESENSQSDYGKTKEGTGSRQSDYRETNDKAGDNQLTYGETKKETESQESAYGETRKEVEDNKTENSLLTLLSQAETQAITKSMETGALHDFIVLFENPKQAKQPDTWRRFFLTEAFLGEQFQEEFGKGLFTYLSQQTVCPADNLPMGLLQELAVAYAFIPHFAGEEYFDGLKYPKEWYKVSVENTFPARKYAAEIFNMQGRECDLKSMTNRILRQPAIKVRHNAFSDYLAMKEMNKEGRLTEGEKETWQHILGACQPYYLYERNGKKAVTADYESRSESVVKLYVQWLKDERLPVEVLLYFYRKLDFKNLEHSSTRGLYGALKEEVLRQCPQAEEILFEENGKEQRIVKLFKTYSSIINANQTNYDKFIYGETPEIRERTEAFFALPEWEQLKGEKSLFERIYGTSKRIVMPRTLAETLIRHLSEGDFPEPERTELTESLLRSLSTEKMLRELDYRCECSFRSTDPGDIRDNPDFWQYFLMRGFGFRHEKIRGSWEEDFIYTQDSQCYLPAYINYIYAPSREWQRRFTGFDGEQEEIAVPVSLLCPMPGNRKLRVEFHYHYCLYFVDEKQVTAPVLQFSQLQEYGESLEKPEEFFFLLAVTAIEEAEKGPARTLIETWLRRIPLHPFIIPTVARLLAADNDRVPGSVPKRTEPACEERQTALGDEGRYLRFCAEAVLYSEQERFCFRAVVSERGLKIWRQMDYGWQDTIFRSGEQGWQKWDEYTWENYPEKAGEEGGTMSVKTDTPEGRRTAAIIALQSLRQPRPRIRAVYSLEGMDMEQKASAILAAMDGLESREGYCVLRYGEKKEKRHDRVFYGALAPFGFDLKAHSAAYVRSGDFLTASSNTKIKEPKVLVGRFGWGFKYAPRSDYGPMYVYQGESGKFYAYGAVRMHRGDSLAQLLADFFRTEWEGVTEAAAYEGCLTVSRLDHRLEYCYTEEDMRQSMSSPADTAADRFTLFGGYGMWVEFVRWMDGILSQELPAWVNTIVVGLDWEKGGALTFAGIHENESQVEMEEMGEEEKGDLDSTYLPQVPLLVWAKGMDRRDRAGFLANAMQWYVDCGRFAGMTGGRELRILVSG